MADDGCRDVGAGLEDELLEDLAVLAGYPNAEVVWVQDEPENQGAWPFIALEAAAKLDGRAVRGITRPAAASTATGSPKVHAVEQAKLIEQALTL